MLEPWFPMRQGCVVARHRHRHRRRGVVLVVVAGVVAAGLVVVPGVPALALPGGGVVVASGVGEGLSGLLSGRSWKTSLDGWN